MSRGTFNIEFWVLQQFIASIITLIKHDYGSVRFIFLHVVTSSVEMLRTEIIILL